MTKRTIKNWFIVTMYSFPVQLIVVHLKKNLELLLFWLILFASIFQLIGKKYGVPYLLLGPEYLESIDFKSFFLVGFSFGGFVMAFNIASYIMNGFRFPFLATLSKPFLKYCINNSILPILFTVCYVIKSLEFLHLYEEFTYQEAALHLSGFLIGYALFICPSMAYFMATNKDFEKLFGKDLGKVINSDTSKKSPAASLFQKSKRLWYRKHNRLKYWRVDSYIGKNFIPKRTRPWRHYDRKMLSQVFEQNKVNATIFEVVVIISILCLGIFRENDWFMLPAAATILLLFILLLMTSSALRSWLKGWSFLITILLFIGFNHFTQLNKTYYSSRAVGLNYNMKEATFKELSSSEKKSQKQNMFSILENWKEKNSTSKIKKPKAVFICTSGGGSRAALWSLTALQHLDSITNGELYQHCISITGSSGGMIGAAYFRETQLLKNISSSVAQRNIGKDLLNPVLFTLAINDMFVKTGKLQIEGHSFWKDRGYAFENKLNKNCNNVFQKNLEAYKSLEYSAQIPLMIFSPSIVNNGKRLLVSSQELGFMTDNEDIDYQSNFKNHDPLKLKFSNLLRMNATFPIIMPTISFPAGNKFEVMDAGLRDNFGLNTTLKFISSVEKWLSENTSEIVIIQIRDLIEESVEPKKKKGFIAETLSPVESLYGNLFAIQDFHNQQFLKQTKKWYNGKIQLLNYQLNKTDNNHISLSWHLSSKEKKQVINSIKLTSNKKVETTLKSLLLKE